MRILEYFQMHYYIKIINFLYSTSLGFQGGSMVKISPASSRDAKDTGSIPGLGRSPGVGNGNPLQYFCLGKPMDRGVWWATVHGVSKSLKQLNNFECSTHSTSLMERKHL